MSHVEPCFRTNHAVRQRHLESTRAAPPGSHCRLAQHLGLRVPHQSRCGWIAGGSPAAGATRCESRGLQTIPLSTLRQQPPAEYQLGPGDVLGVFIPGVLGTVGAEPPVRFERTDLPPALGFPVTVRTDGVLALPLINPIQVRGMTLAQLEQEIRRIYLEKQL